MKTYSNIPRSLIESAAAVLRGDHINEDFDLYEEIIENADDLDEEFEDWYAEEVGISLEEDAAERARKKEMKNAFRAGRKSMDMKYGVRTTDDGSDELPKFTKDKTTNKLFKAGQKANDDGFAKFRNDPIQTSHRELGTANKIKAQRRAPNMPGLSKPRSRVSGNEFEVKPKETPPSFSGSREIVSANKNDLNRAREIAKAFNKAQPKDKRVKVQYFDRKDGMKIYITGDSSSVSALKSKMPSSRG